MKIGKKKNKLLNVFWFRANTMSAHNHKTKVITKVSVKSVWICKTQNWQIIDLPQKRKIAPLWCFCTSADNLAHLANIDFMQTWIYSEMHCLLSSGSNHSPYWVYCSAFLVPWMICYRLEGNLRCHGAHLHCKQPVAEVQAFPVGSRKERNSMMRVRSQPEKCWPQLSLKPISSISPSARRFFFSPPFSLSGTYRVIPKSQRATSAQYPSHLALFTLATERYSCILFNRKAHNVYTSLGFYAIGCFGLVESEWK